MDVASSLPAFVLAVVLISVSPGPAMALVIRRAALRGTGGAVPVVLGLEVGLYVWALLAGAGFAALVAASEIAYLVLRVVGAVVLLVLGIRAWRAAWCVGRQPDTAGERVSSAGHRRWWTAFGEGLVVQLANPKAAVLMLALYPQFVPVDGPVFATTALLGLLQVGLETGLYLGLAAGVARAGSWFRRPRIRRRLEAVSGTVLVALGLRVAVSSR
ncbi:LysE family translocator [Geodermatophilus sp. URMC 61]|uniref:LysE family translocator n=1 Tax=Geodermatophilus sp. URMC 61 TaxID=3423411 RepID=UPI00406CB56A